MTEPYDEVVQPLFVKMPVQCGHNDPRQRGTSLKWMDEAMPTVTDLCSIPHAVAAHINIRSC